MYRRETPVTKNVRTRLWSSYRSSTMNANNDFDLDGGIASDDNHSTIDAHLRGDRRG
jgi:hypothetical protein